MKLNRKATAILGISFFVLIGIAASKPPKDKYKNLKVLPKNISEQTMEKVMDEFTKGLQIDCDFCHARSKKDTSELDFASDERPEKEVARKMITMTNKINKDFFNANTKYGDENAVLEIRCVTCHRGDPHPSVEEDEAPKQQEGVKQ